MDEKIFFSYIDEKFTLKLLVELTLNQPKIIKRNALVGTINANKFGFFTYGLRVDSNKAVQIIIIKIND